MNEWPFAIAGLRFAAVRCNRPTPHWRLKTPDGKILEPGTAGLKSSSRLRLKASLEDIYRRSGVDRFREEFGGGVIPLSEALPAHRRQPDEQPLPYR